MQGARERRADAGAAGHLASNEERVRPHPAGATLSAGEQEPARRAALSRLVSILVQQRIPSSCQRPAYATLGLGFDRAQLRDGAAQEICAMPIKFSLCFRSIQNYSL